MDVIDDIFGTLELRGSLYFRTDYSPPWGVQVPAYQQAARFHLVVQGDCYLGVEDLPPVHLRSGDFVLITGGRAHTLADQPERQKPPLEQVIAESGYTGEGVFVVGDSDRQASTQLICGHLNFMAGADHGLLRALPPYIHITAAQRAEYSWLDEVLRLITRNMYQQALGSVATVTRLSEVVFIEAIRACANQSEGLSRYVAGLSDPPIRKALALMHARPQDDWTLERLATEVAMSRSRFAERFTRHLGCGAMSYLAEWRMQKAVSLLRRTQLDVQQIADRVGYASPAAFSRAFAAHHGCSPREFRQGLLVEKVA